MPANPRLTYEQSYRQLQDLGWLDPGPTPPLPAAPPTIDDDPSGVSFFRTHVEDLTLHNAALPRTLFARSDIRNCSFRNCDLSESVLCWNDWSDIDFSSCTLARCDLRASTYTRVSFAHADLRSADLRLARFTNCDFTGADLAGALIPRFTRWSLKLSRPQRARARLCLRSGPQPPGG